MPVYSYEGLNSAGKRIKGVEDGDSPVAVRNKLRKQGIFPTEVAEERAATASNQTSGLARLNVELFARVPQRDIALCIRQLGTLLRAGMPLVAALNAIVEQIGETRLAHILTLVRESVNGGASLADALGAHPRTFQPLMVNMIRAGEAGGALDVVLERLADLLEKQASLRRKVQEVILARRLEQTLTKEQILELYLNQIYLGHGRYGVQEAARFYFDKDVHKLGLAEAALDFTREQLEAAGFEIDYGAGAGTVPAAVDKFIQLEVGAGETTIGDGQEIAFTEDSLILDDLLELIISRAKQARAGADGAATESQQ